MKFKTSKTNIQVIEAKMLMTLGERCLLPGMEQKGPFAMKKYSLPCCGEGYKGMSYVSIHWLVPKIYCTLLYTYISIKKKKGMGLKWEVRATDFMGDFFSPINKQTNKQKQMRPWIPHKGSRQELKTYPCPPHHTIRQIKGHALQDSQQSRLRL